MPPQKSSLSDPLYMVLARKLVLLLLLMLTTVMGLVALLLKTRPSMLWLAFLLVHSVIGLVAGFSIRWIIPKKVPVLRIGLIIAFIIGSLALLHWFTGLDFGFYFLKAGAGRVDWAEMGQILLAIGIALLALFAWQHLAQRPAKGRRAKSTKNSHHTREKPEEQLERSSRTQPAGTSSNQTIPTPPEEQPIRSTRPKRKRPNHSKPRLSLSAQEEHRCPYCLELIDPDDPRGTVECEICHTLHHADCWAITGACQVPHFTT